MDTYLVVYRWRYMPLDQMENYNVNSQDPVYVSWLTYHALFPRELIIKTELRGEELYHYIREEVEKRIKDPKNNQAIFIDNVIKL